MLSRAYKHYVLAVLTLLYTLNCLDRALIILLLQPIKQDLHLSDTQLGFLTGIAFALFYTIFGVPVARWADRGNRVNIASLAIALWGVMVMLCMFVGNFLQLVAARVACAVGESGGAPPTYSLLGDYFPEPVERTRAMSIYSLSDPVALLVSFLLGAWLNEHFGWRASFFAMGIPGLLVGAVVKLTVLDPRPRTPAYRPGSTTRPRVVDVLGILWDRRSARHLTFALILLYTMGAGLSPWYAAFLMRSHGMSTSELGVWLGLIFGLGGVVGILLGGYVAGRWFGQDVKGQMRLSAIVVASLVPFYLTFLLMPGRDEALITLVPLIVAGNFIFGPIFALMQRMVPNETRATAMAVIMLLANLIGMGAGPQVVGVISDMLAPRFGNESLRYAMVIMSCVALWAGYHFWRSSATIGKDIHDAGSTYERSPVDCAASPAVDSSDI